MRIISTLLMSMGLVMVSVTPVNAMTDEAIFEKAKQFTIKISTTIKTPFIFDEKTSLIGTGFLIDKQRGWLITNAHVAGRSPSEVEGSFYKKDNVTLKKIYVDPVIDIAILKINPNAIPATATQAKLDCMTKVNPGYAVGAYGHPWGLNYTATRGIVSGTPYLVRTKWIQTDAPINGGNSGGPLLSMTTGHVVGINSATLAKSETEGLNFALPIKYACKIVDLLKQGMNPAPHQLPVIFYKAHNDESLTVAKVTQSPASQFRENDIIKGIKGNTAIIDNPMELWHELRDKQGQVILNVERDGKVIEVTLDLVKQPSVIGRKALYIDGMTISPSHLFDGEFYNLSSSWVVNDVESGTTAESKGIANWGVVTHINNQPLGSYDHVRALLNTRKPITLRIQYENGGHWQFYDYQKVDLPRKTIKELKI